MCLCVPVVLKASIGVQDSFVIHLVERPAASSAASSSSSGAAGPAAQPEPQPQQQQQQQQQGDFVTSFQVSGPNAIQNVGSVQAHSFFFVLILVLSLCKTS